jgi:CBS domain-containing protein
MMRKIIPDVLTDPNVQSVKLNTTVMDAATLMRDHDVGAVAVMSDNILKGILTVNDVAYRVVAEGLEPENTVVETVMTPSPDTIRPDSTAIEALRLMQIGGYRHLPVEKDGHVLAVISRRDFFGQEKARLDDETALWERIA